MPWCPKCKSHYPEDSKVCWNCNLPLIYADPEQQDKIIAQSSDQSTSGCIQVFAIWITVLLAVLVIYLLGGAISGTSTVLAAIVAVSASTAIIFGGGYYMASLLTTTYICIAWGFAALPALIFLSLGAIQSGDRGSGGSLVATILLCAVTGAVVISCGKKYRQTRNWVYVLVPIACAGITTASLM